MGDRGESGIKNLKKWETSFMDGPLVNIFDGLPTVKDEYYQFKLYPSSLLSVYNSLSDEIHFWMIRASVY